MIFEKKRNPDNKIRIEFYIKNFLKKATFQNQSDFKNNFDFIFNIDMTDNDKNIINKIENHKSTEKLEKLLNINNGIVTGNDKKFLSKVKVNENYKVTIRGREIKKYYSDVSYNFINYSKTQLLRARNEDIFLANEKLIMQMINTNFVII